MERIRPVFFSVEKKSSDSMFFWLICLSGSTTWTSWVAKEIPWQADESFGASKPKKMPGEMYENPRKHTLNYVTM